MANIDEGLLKHALKSKPNEISIYTNIRKNPVFINFLEKIRVDGNHNELLSYIEAINTEAIIPLRSVDGKLLSVICLYHKTHVEPTESHIKWLESLQFRAARALEICERFEEAKDLQDLLVKAALYRGEVGYFTQGIAHEIKGFFQRMLNIEFRLRQITDKLNDSAREDLDSLFQQVKSGSDRIDTLRRFVTKVREGGVTDINQVIQEVLELKKGELELLKIQVINELQNVPAVSMSFDEASLSMTIK